MEATTQSIENPSPFTWEQLASCMKRELGKRQGFYPKLVATDKMSQEEADQEIQKMAAAADHFDQLAGKPLVQYVTRKQREEITRLCNHPMISRSEKNKMLLALPRFTSEYAEQAITKMVETIELRENMRQQAA